MQRVLSMSIPAALTCLLAGCALILDPAQNPTKPIVYTFTTRHAKAENLRRAEQFFTRFNDSLEEYKRDAKMKAWRVKIAVKKVERAGDAVVVTGNVSLQSTYDKFKLTIKAVDKAYTLTYSDVMLWDVFGHYPIKYKMHQDELAEMLTAMHTLLQGEMH